MRDTCKRCFLTSLKPQSPHRTLDEQVLVGPIQVSILRGISPRIALKVNCTRKVLEMAMVPRTVTVTPMQTSQTSIGKKSWHTQSHSRLWGSVACYQRTQLGRSSQILSLLRHWVGCKPLRSRLLSPKTTCLKKVRSSIAKLSERRTFTTTSS